MICFHSLIYWYFTQRPITFLTVTYSCDLLSFFDLLIFHTARCRTFRYIYRLWFAFILWFIDISHSWYWCAKERSGVVICFHSLIYWYFTQHGELPCIFFVSCDLLSFFDLLIFHTANTPANHYPPTLWFAFILWFIDISHSFQNVIKKAELVVICFHSLIYWYFTQLAFLPSCPCQGCDLLSFFDLLIFHTAPTGVTTPLP